MELQEGKQKFIHAWGVLGTNWGINRAMAQVHALLLITPTPLSADEIMDELQISRGSVNLNLRALMDWGLVHKELRQGERREFFLAEKDMWMIFRQIVIQRKKRELEPVIKVLDDLDPIEGETPEIVEFRRVVEGMRLFAHKAEATLDGIVRSEAAWFVETFMSMVK